LGPRTVVLLFAAGLSVVAAAAAGVIPALVPSRSGLMTVTRRAGPSVGAAPAGHRLRSALAVVQIALSLVLIIGAGLFLRSLAKLRAVDPSLASDRIVAATINLTLRGYSEEQGLQFYESLLERVRREPGIDGAALRCPTPARRRRT
ncbi:MAG: hypothetical protein ACRD09_06885, partial [Vicinamibacterales bacterium]